MERSSILAHRGYFLKESERNSAVALNRALEYGFGLETDVRDLNGRLVISHDPPLDSSLPTELSWLFERIVTSGSTARIALNVKADGLKTAIYELVKLTGINLDQIYVFDMSVPDGLAYISSPMHAYSRVSEYENRPAYADKVRGVWVDNFTGAFPQVERAADLMSKGIRAAIVSPELHRRNHLQLWSAILDSGIYENTLFEICTDLPVEAANYFCYP